MHNLQEMAAEFDDLVALPKVATTILTMIEDDSSSAEDVSELITTDPALSASMLRTANSAAFVSTQQVDNVTKALTFLGTERVKDIVLTLSVSKAFQGLPSDLVSMSSFWLHNVYCSLIAAELGKTAKLPCRNSLFTVGMLHDLGHMALWQLESKQSESILLEHINGVLDLELWELETEVFGFHHGQMGSEICRNWHFPESLCTPIEYHHQPFEAPEHKEAAMTLYLANQLSSDAETGEDPTELLTDIDPTVLDCVGIDNEGAKLAIETARANAMKLLSSFT